MIKQNKKSLAFRINLIAFGVVGLLFLFFWFNLYLTGQSMERLEKAKVEASVKSQLSTLEEALYFGFEKPVEEIVSQLLKQNPAIESITLYQNGKRQVFKSPRPVPQAGREFEEVFPLTYRNKTIGKLAVRYRTLYAARYYDGYLSQLLIVFVVVVLLLLIVVYSINRNISRLTHFAEQLRGLDPQKVKSVKPEADFFEFKYIADAVNKMLKRIHDYAEHLTNLNKKLTENERKLMRAQRIARMISWSYYPDTKQIDVTYEFYRLFEIKRRETGRLRLRQMIRYIHPEDRKIFLNTLSEAIKEGKKFELIHKVVTTRGKIRHFRTEGRVHKSKKRPTEMIGVSMDVTEEVEAKQQADYMALYDPLTGLMNRRSLQEHLDYMILLASRYKKRLALLFIDLDNFKVINDSYGHGVGDDLLVRIAEMLKRSVRESDIVSRIGGDEFVIAFTDIQNREAVKLLAEKILEMVAVTYQIENHQFNVTISMGAAIFPDDAKDGDTLMRFADAAMYEAKKAGKNRIVLFNDKIRKSLEDRRDIIEELKDALKTEDQILLYFQPQIDLKSGRVIGAEVLTRWHHPVRGIVFPNDYIPLIEGSALMNQYDDYVLQMAFKQLKKWNDRYPYRWKLGINLSAGQFSSRRLIEKLESCLKTYPIDPSQLDLEITESLPMQDVSMAIGTLQAIKSLGFSISIDDFGTGYSSLSYLQRLPFDVIKIDREFVKDMHRDEDSKVIVGLMIQMGKTLGKKTIAEGPDIEEHITILKALGCDYAQGFYYSKAVPEEAFVAYALEKIGK